MSGLFELLVIGFFVVAAAFDAIQRNRRKEQRKREMEEHEANAEAPPTPRQRREREAAELSAGEPSDPDEPASTMLPEDLWQILTGQDSGTDRPEGPREPEPPAPPSAPAPAHVERSSALHESLEEPWHRFEDISDAEILEGGGRVQRAVQTGSGASGPAGSRGPASRYTRMLRSGRLEDLRGAIVLREVLGRPVGFREPGDERH